MTTCLYYEDSLLTRFDATVAESGALADGRPFVVLDRTAFYPTSGGQPHDVGRLDHSRVTDVIDRDEDHAVVHVTDVPLAAGTAVSGEIGDARLDAALDQGSFSGVGGANPTTEPPGKKDCDCDRADLKERSGREQCCQGPRCCQSLRRCSRDASRCSGFYSQRA